MEQKKRLRSDQRIRNQTSFKDLVGKGTFARGKIFYLWAMRREKNPPSAKNNRPMIGIAVGRNTHKSAVKRNTLKRQIREIFRDHQERLKEGTLCLVKTKRLAKRPLFPEMKAELISLFKQTGVWI